MRADYPPGYFPDPAKKLGMQPDLTANTSGGSTTTNSGVGLLFPEYTYPNSSSHKESVPLAPGMIITGLFHNLCMVCSIRHRLEK